VPRHTDGSDATHYDAWRHGLVGRRVVGGGNREPNAAPRPVAAGPTGAELGLFFRTRCVLWGPQVVGTRVEPFPNPALTLMAGETSGPHGARRDLLAPASG
jgi:hypothetical protein